MHAYDFKLNRHIKHIKLYGKKKNAYEETFLQNKSADKVFHKVKSRVPLIQCLISS